MEIETIISMDSHGPPVTDADILRFEQTLGCRLPEDYREFLLAFNGGQPSLEQSMFATDNYTATLNSFCKLKSPRGNIEKIRQFLMEDEVFPGDLLVIGHDDGGSRVCLVIYGDKRGEVWLNDLLDPHDPKLFLEWYERKRDFKKLADSFTDFIKMLQPYPKV